MARIFIDGFEDQDAGFKLWDTVNGTPSIVAPATSGLDTYAAHFNGLSSIVKSVSSGSEIYGGCLHKVVSSSGAFFALRVMNGSVEEDILFLKTYNNKIRVTGTINVGGTPTETSWTSTDLVMAGGAKYVEWHFKLSTAGAGIVQVKVNGVLVIDESSLDFTYATFVGYDLQCEANTEFYIDNFVLDDAAWTGVSSIQAIVPAADGNSSGWTPSTGTDNYALVDEIPPSTTDYVSTTAVDTLDQYTVTPLTGTIGTIKSVQVQSSLRTLGEPTFTNFAHCLRISSTDYFGSDTAIPGPSFEESDYKTYATIWETSPATAVAFTESEVNAMEIGIKTKA